MNDCGSVMFSGMIRCFAAAACLAAWPATAWPQEYPVKPVRMLVPFAAGGGLSLIGHVMAQKLSAALGQAVVVENRPGANGNIAAELVAKSAPDGYMLLFGNSSLSTSPAIFHKLAYSPTKDLAPISMVSSLAFVLSVHPSMPVRSVKELVALAKVRPGELDYASAGTGSLSHLSMELMRLRTGIKVVHLPYKGSAPAQIAVMSGEVQGAFLGVPGARSEITAGRLRGLGVTTKTRAAVIPQVPTMQEAGIAGYEVVQWNGLFARTGTPQTVLDRLYRELTRALATPEFRQQLKALGTDPQGSTPSEFAAFLRVETEKWAEVAKRSNIRLD